MFYNFGAWYTYYLLTFINQKRLPILHLAVVYIFWFFGSISPFEFFNTSRKHAYIILTPLNPTFILTSANPFWVNIAEHENFSANKS